MSTVYGYFEQRDIKAEKGRKEAKGAKGDNLTDPETKAKLAKNLNIRRRLSAINLPPSGKVYPPLRAACCLRRP